MAEAEAVQRTLHDMSNVGTALHMDRRRVEAEAKADPDRWRLKDWHLYNSVPAVRNVRTASAAVAVARGTQIQCIAGVEDETSRAGNANRQVVLCW